MKTIEGIIERATLASGTPMEHQGYVVSRLSSKDRKKTFNTPLYTLNGHVSEEFNGFVNRICTIIGEQEGLIFKAKMIQSYVLETGQYLTWSI